MKLSSILLRCSPFQVVWDVYTHAKEEGGEEVKGSGRKEEFVCEHESTPESWDLDGYKTVTSLLTAVVPIRCSWFVGILLHESPNPVLLGHSGPERHFLSVPMTP